MKYQVVLIQEAEDDLFDIYKYICEHDTLDSANYVLSKIEELCFSLHEMPTRGHFLPELDAINIRNYREVHFKPYRVIYEIEEKKVFIHCILDSRRDLRDLLERRLLR